MIVLPSLLRDLLDEVDETRAAHLALDFARHVLDIERAEIEEPVLEACLVHIAAAHEAIDLGEAHPRLFRAHERLLETGMRWEGHRYDAARGVEPTLQAARVGTEQLMSDAKGYGQVSLLPCFSVAREMQARAGRWYAQRAPDGADERLAARRARWEEARWQVLHILATEPGPDDKGR
ncbi:hypothetical protein [Streptomyces sp. NPDC059787]|uniref:hypothetical protein n=1 Tax=Streptomyces sp. NPDC059787 TaxID=3346947 RepID=UPI00364F0F03